MKTGRRCPDCCRIVLTGGPGGGKTTAVDLFRREIGERVVVIPEAATNVDIGYLFNCRSLHRSVASIGVFNNRAAIAGAFLMVALQLFFTYAPLMHATFHTASIDLGPWLRIAAVSALSFVVVEIEKWLRRSKPISMGTTKPKQ